MDAVTILKAARAADGELIDMVIKDCNTPAADLAGKARIDIVGRMLCDVTPTIRPFLTHFERCMQSGERQDAQLVAFEPHLVGHWFHHQLVPLDDGVALITRDVTQRVAHEASLSSMARLDALTGLPNRRAFEEALVKAHARSRRTGAALALVYVDLDGFKGVNDRLGHAAGDAVLVEVARRLQALLRNVDTVCRLGGDEFTVIIENSGSEADLAEVCRRIQVALSARYVWNGADASTTPSIGCVVHRVGDEVLELMTRADAAMYRAKAAGKARFDLVAS
jgi:diguanylate cyclase (GGDEF)-like protein